MWQEIVVGICIIGALIFLVRRWLPGGKKKSAGCGSGCGDCSSPKNCNTPTPSNQSDGNTRP